jgi:transmembrane sensor
MPVKMDQSILDKFWKGECDKEEVIKVLKWFNSIDAEIYFGDNVDFIWHQYQKGKVPHNLKKIAFAKIQSTIGDGSAEEIMPKNLAGPRQSYVSIYLKVAAIITFLMVAIGTIKFVVIEKGVIDEQTKAIEWTEKSTKPGQKLTIFLNDGTKVILNAASTLKYAEVYLDTPRYVFLQGEAFFEVAHDTLSQFIVFTDNISTTALGTSFNIRAYPTEPDIKVDLITGKVLVKSDQHSEVNHLLDIGEGVVFNKRTTEINKYRYDPVSVLSWKKGIIYFKDATNEQIFAELSLWYGVEFEVKKPLQKGKLYTGAFDNLSLREVLEGLSYTKDFTYIINNGKVTIK